MSKHPDVAIVGGGIIGLTCAYFLAKEGLSVEVFDRGDLGREASWAGAGIIPPGNVAGAAKPIDRLRAIGSQRFPAFSAELRERTGIENGYLACGGIEFLSEADKDALSVWRDEGIAFEQLTRGRLSACEPVIEYLPAEPYLLPDCAQVRNPRHLLALTSACERIGVRLHPGIGVESWARTTTSRVRATFSDGIAREPGRFLLAAGAWSESLLGFLNHRPGVYPVRGQIVLLKSATQLFTRVLMAGKRYLVPRADGHVLIGSTEEPESRFEKANTDEGVRDLLSFATRLVPSLSGANLEKCWSGLRPGTPDGAPFIGPIPGSGNAFVATGHFRAGIQLSIGTAFAITELLTGKPTCVPLDAFALDRKPSVERKGAFRS